MENVGKENQYQHMGISNKNTTIEVELVIVSELINICDISHILKLAHSAAWEKGDPVPNKPYCRKDTTWSYSIGIKESYDIREQSRHFLEIFEQKTPDLIHLVTNLKVECCILYTIKVLKDQTPIFSLENDIISFADKVKANIDFDTYF